MRDLINSETATIVDVRTTLEFMMGKVKGSKNIPMDQVPGRVEEFKNMSKPLILCCATGNRSGQVANFLSAQGVSEVYNAGGWREVQDQLSR